MRALLLLLLCAAGCTPLDFGPDRSDPFYHPPVRPEITTAPVLTTEQRQEIAQRAEANLARVRFGFAVQHYENAVRQLRNVR